MIVRRVGAGALTIAAIAMVACAGDDGTSDDTLTISVFGPNRGVEADRFSEMVAPFTESTGIEVRYTGSANFVADLGVRTGDANDPPDVALVPQPGLVAGLVSDEEILPLDPATVAEIEAHYDDETRPLGVVDGVDYGVPIRVNVKSLVWFRPDVFAEHGWSPPESLGELEELVDEISAESELAAWCFTMSDGTATGWTATDWTEDLVLRHLGEEDYAAWADGSLPFADPRIERAFDDFRRVVLTPPHLHGGLRHAVEVPVHDGLDPLLSDEPECAMAKQGDFARSWMPPDIAIGAAGDIAWFVLPAVRSGDEPPLVVGANVAVQFERSDAIDAFMEYLAGPDAGSSWASAGGFLSPKSTFDPAGYPDDASRDLAALVHDADVLAFDASDLMPVEIGSGLLWREITSWVATTTTYDEFAATIDAALAG